MSRTIKSPDVASGPEQVAQSAPVESTADLGAIASGLASSMPQVQEHAIQQAEQQAKAAEGAPVDKAGVRFDPSQHVAGADGKGQLTVRGTWAQKRGRKAGMPQKTCKIRNWSHNRHKTRNRA